MGPRLFRLFIPNVNEVMSVRTYRAKTMQEALALVRRELGPRASVLHTREVPAAVAG